MKKIYFTIRNIAGFFVNRVNTIVPLTATVLMSWVHISALASLDLLAMVKFILYKSAKLLINLFTSLARQK